MGYEDMIEDLLRPGRPMSLQDIARALRPDPIRQRMRPFATFALLHRHLRANPGRYVEVAPGIWMRRDDGGPEAGVPGRPRRPPLAGSAAAEASPPASPAHLDVTGGTAGRATLPSH